MKATQICKTACVESTRGQLLVATPGLTDPNFRMAVLLMIEHNSDGALGVMLNKPSSVPVASASSNWHDVAAEPKVVFLGGPVSQSSLIGLASTVNDDSFQQRLSPAERIGAVDLEQISRSLHKSSALRIFAGYASWAPGQLEAEIADDAWFVLRLAPSDPFTAFPDDLWWQVFARQEDAELRHLRLYPDNPSDN